MTITESTTEAKSVLWAEHDLLRELRLYRSDKSENQINRVAHAAKTLARELVSKFPKLENVVRDAGANELLDIAYQVSVL